MPGHFESAAVCITLAALFLVLGNIVNILNKIVMLLASASLCVACQKAVKAPEDAVYSIQGSKQSLLFPLEVKQKGEDVFITLAPNAPLPEISSYDAAENKIPFNFSLVENTIVVPEKFEHLRLSHGKDDVIDIFRKNKD